MKKSELKAIIAKGEDSRNPILVSYVAKGLLPHRGLGSGITRALEAWPEMDFVDDRDGCLFTAIVHQKTEKSSEKILFLLKAEPKLSAREVATGSKSVRHRLAFCRRFEKVRHRLTN